MGGSSWSGTSPAKPNRPVAGDDSAGSILLAPKNIKDLRDNVDVFTHDEMRLATKNFLPDLILGEGGFGVVYKGVMDEHVREGYKSTQVAIKVLNPEGFQGDIEWLVIYCIIAFCLLSTYI
ncbi:non-specific serine/threonine protein kinase [Ranunculus cassubicifolius]